MGVSYRDGVDPRTGWVPVSEPNTHRLARAMAQREDARLVAVVASQVGLPYQVSVVSIPDQHTLEVRVPGVRLAAVGRDVMRAADSSEDVARHLGQLARRGWFNMPAAAVPDNIVLGSE